MIVWYLLQEPVGDAFAACYAVTQDFVLRPGVERRKGVDPAQEILS